MKASRISARPTTVNGIDYWLVWVPNEKKPGAFHLYCATKEQLDLYK